MVLTMIVLFQVYSSTFSMATATVQKPSNQTKDQRKSLFYHRRQTLVKRSRNTRHVPNIIIQLINNQKAHIFTVFKGGSTMPFRISRLWNSITVSLRDRMLTKNVQLYKEPPKHLSIYQWTENLVTIYITTSRWSYVHYLYLLRLIEFKSTWWKFFFFNTIFLIDKTDIFTNCYSEERPTVATRQSFD